MMTKLEKLAKLEDTLTAQQKSAFLNCFLGSLSMHIDAASWEKALEIAYRYAANKDVPTAVQS